MLQSDGEADVSGEQLHEILREIDTNMNGQVELDEYLQVGNKKKTKENEPHISTQKKNTQFFDWNQTKTSVLNGHKTIYFNQKKKNKHFNPCIQ